MQPEDNDPRKPRRGPFDPFDFDSFDEMFRSMGMDMRDFHRMFDDIQRQLMDAMRNAGAEPGKPVVHGFSFKVGPDGKPQFEHFGNRPPSIDPSQFTSGTPLNVSDTREPLTDIIEGDKDIAVTLEVPGVEKGDIKVSAKAERIEISVDNEMRKYHKVVNLPAKVDPATTKATYNNGILDITVQKIDHDDGGVSIQVE